MSTKKPKTKDILNGWKPKRIPVEGIELSEQELQFLDECCTQWELSRAQAFRHILRCFQLYETVVPNDELADRMKRKFPSRKLAEGYVVCGECGKIGVMCEKDPGCCQACGDREQ